MGGAACVVAACRAVAGLQLPINIRALVSKYEIIQWIFSTTEACL